MAQNVTIAGASYQNVPAIDVPKTAGGQARYYDCVDTKTITENGTVDVKGCASVTVNIAYNICRSGTGEPSSSLGNNGDWYLVMEG